MGSQRVRHDWATELNWLNGLVVFLVSSIKSEFGNIEFMIWSTVSSVSHFWWLYKTSPSSAAHNIINTILIVTIWYGHVQSRLLCCWKRMFVMTIAFSWQNSVSHFPVSFCTPRPTLLVIPGFSWFPMFAFESSMMKSTSLLLLLVLEGLVGHHRTVQLQFLWHYWSGHRLGLPWYWMVCLGNEQRSFCCFFEIASKYCILDSFVDYYGYSISLRDFCPQ